MLTKVFIKNFQAHSKSTLKLCPGVNIITGHSDNGKSSIIRSIGWVISNRPSGNAFRRDGTSEDEPIVVKLVTDDSGQIVRRKSAQENAYKTDDEVFKALRSDVPDEIAELLDLSEVNIQGQHSPYFLINDSPGEVAKKLYSLIDMDVIDSVLSRINKRVLQLNNEAKSSLASADRKRDEIAEFPDLDALEKSAVKCVKMQGIVSANKKSINTINEILSKVVDAEGIINGTLYIFHEEDAILKCEKMLKSALSTRKHVNILSQIVTSLDKCTEEIKEASQWCEGMHKELDAFDERYKEYLKIQNEIELLTTALAKYEKAENALETAEVSLQKASNSLAAFIKKNPICPLCGGKMK